MQLSYNLRAKRLRFVAVLAWKLKAETRRKTRPSGFLREGREREIAQRASNASHSVYILALFDKRLWLPPGVIR
jgi:hypothetical protein